MYIHLYICKYIHIYLHRCTRVEVKKYIFICIYCPSLPLCIYMYICLSGLAINQRIAPNLSSINPSIRLSIPPNFIDCPARGEFMYIYIYIYCISVLYLCNRRPKTWNLGRIIVIIIVMIIVGILPEVGGGPLIYLPSVYLHFKYKYVHRCIYEYFPI